MGWWSANTIASPSQFHFFACKRELRPCGGDPTSFFKCCSASFSLPQQILRSLPSYLPFFSFPPPFRVLSVWCRGGPHVGLCVYSSAKFSFFSIKRGRRKLRPRNAEAFLTLRNVAERRNPLLLQWSSSWRCLPDYNERLTSEEDSAAPKANPSRGWLLGR